MGKLSRYLSSVFSKAGKDKKKQSEKIKQERAFGTMAYQLLSGSAATPKNVFVSLFHIYTVGLK